MKPFHWNEYIKKICNIQLDLPHPNDSPIPVCRLMNLTTVPFTASFSDYIKAICYSPWRSIIFVRSYLRFQKLNAKFDNSLLYFERTIIRHIWTLLNICIKPFIILILKFHFLKLDQITVKLNKLSIKYIFILFIDTIGQSIIWFTHHLTCHGVLISVTIFGLVAEYSGYRLLWNTPPYTSIQAAVSLHNLCFVTASNNVNPLPCSMSVRRLVAGWFVVAEICSPRRCLATTV
jgi:hypothetical protein